MSVQTIIDMSLVITSLHDTANDQGKKIQELEAKLEEKDDMLKESEKLIHELKHQIDSISASGSLSNTIDKHRKGE